MKVMYSQPFIHHFMGLFGTNTVTISQLACLLLGRALHQYCIVVTLLHALIFSQFEMKMISFDATNTILTESAGVI